MSHVLAFGAGAVVCFLSVCLIVLCRRSLPFCLRDLLESLFALGETPKPPHPSVFCKCYQCKEMMEDMEWDARYEMERQKEIGQK